MELISGKALSAARKAEMAKEVEQYKAQYGRAPQLTVVLVGEDPGSVSYVTGKAKAAAEAGIDNVALRKPAETTEAELLELID